MSEFWVWWMYWNIIGVHETSLLSQAVLKHVSGVQRFHLQEVYAREQLVQYPAKNEEIYGIIVPYQKNFHVVLHYF